MVNLDLEYLLERSTVYDLASILVHEATHARIERFGIPYKGDRKHRIERLCLDAEIRFLGAYPEAREALLRCLDMKAHIPRYWDPEAHRQRALTQLRELGTPTWLVRLVEWTSGRR